jgi:methionine-S-sulfoxide reductase
MCHALIVLNRAFRHRSLRLPFADRTEGVLHTQVGYIGGASACPTYEEVCGQRNDEGHTEAIRVEFDPSVLSFEQLMLRFFEEATPHIRRKQYMSAVWAQSERQTEIASLVARRLGKDGVPVLPASTWHEAEAAHQKYYERQAAPRVCRRL